MYFFEHAFRLDVNRSVSKGFKSKARYFEEGVILIKVPLSVEFLPEGLLVTEQGKEPVLYEIETVTIGYVKFKLYQIRFLRKHLGCRLFTHEYATSLRVYCKGNKEKDFLVPCTFAYLFEYDFKMHYPEKFESLNRSVRAVDKVSETE